LPARVIGVVCRDALVPLRAMAPGAPIGREGRDGRSCARSRSACRSAPCPVRVGCILRAIFPVPSGRPFPSAFARVSAGLRERPLGMLASRDPFGHEDPGATLRGRTVIERLELELDGRRVSYLHAGDGPPVLLLHGTFWSRIWQPVMDRIGEENEVFAPDYPGFGRSGGRLEPEQADVPALASAVLRFADALGIGEFSVAGHDIGGAVAQNLALSGRVTRLALINSVLYNSWPVPAVSRFRDPKQARGISPEELVEPRRQSLRKALARELNAAEAEEYLSPWRTEDGTRSWTAMAAAADARYTTGLVGTLRELGLPTLLLWGEADEFQPVRYAERFEREMPSARLVTVPGARHIPMEDDPGRVAEELASFFGGRSP
jgi:pimeloyl-ACP methyl ester carboxylesterase